MHAILTSPPLLPTNFHPDPLATFSSGYSDHKGYWCLDLLIHCIISQHVVFYEDVFLLAGSCPPLDLDNLLDTDPAVVPSLPPSSVSPPSFTSCAAPLHLQAPHTTPSRPPAPHVVPSPSPHTVSSPVTAPHATLLPLRLYEPMVYTGTDWVGCPYTRRSTSGYTVFLGANLIS
jgi:hypothetical protein